MKTKEKSIKLVSIMMIALLSIFVMASMAFAATDLNDSSITIELQDASGKKVDENTTSYYFDNTAKKPTVIVKKNGTVISSGYTVNYYNNEIASTQYQPKGNGTFTPLTNYAYARVTGSDGDLVGTRDVYFKIDNPSKSKVHFTITGSKDYDGKVTYAYVKEAYIEGQDGKNKNLHWKGRYFDGSSYTDPYDGQTKTLPTVGLYRVGSYYAEIWDTNLEPTSYSTTSELGDSYNSQTTYFTWLYVKARPFTVNWSTPNRFTYDGKNHVITATINTGVNGETFEVTLKGEKKEVGSYTATAVITKVNMDFSKLGNDAKTAYNNTVSFFASHGETYNPVFSYKVKGDEYDYYFNYEGSGREKVDEDAGTFTFTSPFYIDPRPVTLKADDKTKTKGQTDPTFTWKITSGSWATGETPNVSPLDRQKGEDVGTYAINLSASNVSDNGAFKKSNYNITYQPGKLTITDVEQPPEPETPTPKTIKEPDVSDPQDYVYDGTEKEPHVKVTVDGVELKEGTDYEITWKHNIPVNGIDPEGNPTVVITGKGDYIGTVEKPFNITRRPLVIKADDKTKLKGEKDPELTYKLDGLVKGETPNKTGNLVRDPGEEAGEDYDINQGSLKLENNGKFNVGNYDITYKKGELTITETGTPKLEISVDEEYDYDGTEKKPKPVVYLVNPDGTKKKLKEGTDYTLEYKDNIDARKKTDKNPPTVIVKVTTGVVETKAFPFTINPVPIVVTADNQRIKKGSEIPTLTYTIKGAVNGETPKFDGNPTTTATKDSSVGTYPIDIKKSLTPVANGKFNPDNYTFRYVNAKLEIYDDNPTPIPETPGTEVNTAKDAACTLRNGSKKKDKENDNIYKLNEEVIYYCDYMNKTDNPIYHANMILELPLTWKIVSSDGGKVDTKKGTITWDLGTLKPNEVGSRTVIVKYTAFKDAATNNAKSKIDKDHAMIYPYLTLNELVGGVNNMLDDSAVINEIISDYDKNISTKHIMYMWGDEDKPTFRPEDGISRAEGAMVLLRIFEEDYSEVEVKGDEYTDIMNIYAEARRAIVKASELGVVNGYEDGSFRPKDKMKKKEFMTIIARYIEVVGKRNGIKGLNAENAKNVMIYSATKDWSNPYVTLLARLNMAPIKTEIDMEVNNVIKRSEVAQLCNYYLFRGPVKDDGKIQLPFEDVSSSTNHFGDIVEATRPTHDSAWMDERVNEIYKDKKK